MVSYQNHRANMVKLTGIEPFSVSLVAYIRAGLRSFLQGGYANRDRANIAAHTSV